MTLRYLNELLLLHLHWDGLRLSGRLHYSQTRLSSKVTASCFGVKHNCSWLCLAGFMAALTLWSLGVQFFISFVFSSHTMSNGSLIMSLKFFYQFSYTSLSSLLTHTGSKIMVLSFPGWHFLMGIFPTWPSVWTKHSCCCNTYLPFSQSPSCKLWQPLYPLTLTQQPLIDCVSVTLTLLNCF